jgi:hypothetical protein
MKLDLISALLASIDAQAVGGVVATVDIDNAAFTAAKDELATYYASLPTAVFPPVWRCWTVVRVIDDASPRFDQVGIVQGGNGDTLHVMIDGEVATFDKSQLEKVK